ncbi:MAG: glycosyltransferase [Paracoccus sp. (in: a-proteobacteria)]
MPQGKSICLVTEELACGGPTGGIGSAMLELAELLCADHDVTVLLCQGDRPDRKQRNKLVADLRRRRIRLAFLDPEKYCVRDDNRVGTSYSVFRWLYEHPRQFDVIHFHDYQGLGYHSLCARDQGLAFGNAVFVVQMHGPRRWVLELNQRLFSDPMQLKTDFMERQCIARADYVVSPSRFMLSWLEDTGWELPPGDRQLVIRNACSTLQARMASLTRQVPEAGAAERRQPVTELIFFGRHEFLKGITIFCDALDHIADALRAKDVTVTFLGGFVTQDGRHSGTVLAERGRGWDFPIRMLPFENRDQAMDYLAHAERGLVVVPSPKESFSYTVLEAAMLGRPVLTSSTGGAVELLHDTVRDAMVIDLTPENLAEHLLRAVERGMPPPRLSFDAKQIGDGWLAFHAGALSSRRTPPDMSSGCPLVSVCITHYERPEKLIDAVASIVQQTYLNIELIVVDDGSPGEATRKALTEMQPVIEANGGRLIRRENGYLGAARNTGAEAAHGDYLCFLDDDDIALPEMIETLVTAARNTNADVVTCMQYNMPDIRRSEAWPDPGSFAAKIEYLPLGGGPLSLAAVENVFGPPTALISRAAFDHVGGYSTLKGVGYEDFEFFMNCVQKDLHVELCPFPLYLYEVGVSSMILTTSTHRNFLRVVNAIDTKRHPEAWHDFLQLASSQKALEVGSVRQQALQQISPGMIGAPPPETADPVAILTWLQRASAEIGSLSFQAAYADSRRFYAAERGAGSPPDPDARRMRLTPATQVKRARPPAADPVGRLSPADALARRIARSDGPVRDPQEHVRHILASLKAGGTITAALIADLKALLGADIDADTARTLCTALLRAECRERDRAGLLGPVVIIAEHAGLHGKAVEYFSMLLESCEQRYLLLNPDVAAAVGRKEFANGLIHYLRHGEGESRQGYDGLVHAVYLHNLVHGGNIRTQDMIALFR